MVLAMRKRMEKLWNIVHEMMMTFIHTGKHTGKIGFCRGYFNWRCIKRVVRVSNDSTAVEKLKGISRTTKCTKIR